MFIKITKIKKSPTSLLDRNDRICAYLFCAPFPTCTLHLVDCPDLCHCHLDFWDDHLFPFPGVRRNIGQQCATSPLGSVCAVVGVKVCYWYWHRLWWCLWVSYSADAESSRDCATPPPPTSRRKTTLPQSGKHQSSQSKLWMYSNLFSRMPSLPT